MIGLVEKIVGGIALAVILALSIALFAADRRADKWERQARKLSAKLDQLAEESKANKREAEKRIGQGKERVIVVERKAREIEAAPIEPGLCKTPDAVRSADL